MATAVVHAWRCQYPSSIDIVPMLFKEGEAGAAGRALRAACERQATGAGQGAQHTFEMYDSGTTRPLPSQRFCFWHFLSLLATILLEAQLRAVCYHMI
jgi:hypothetical protein